MALHRPTEQTEHEREFDFHLPRLTAIVLFFLSYPGMHQLGKTKLMKLLYYADFDHMERYDEPITGAIYRKLPQGPVPDEADAALDILAADGRLRMDRVALGRYERFTYAVLAPPDRSALNDAQWETVEAVARHWRFYGLNELVEATHSEAPWLGVEELDPIPYELAYYRNTFGEMNLDPDEVAAMDDDDQSITS